MIVTIQAPSPAAQKRGAFQTMIMGLECTMLADNCLDVTVRDLWKAKHLAGMIDGEILAVIGKVKFDAKEMRNV